MVAALGMTRELARQGHQVTVMTTNIDGPRVLDVPLEQAVDMDGVEVWYYPVQWPRWYCFSRSLGGALKQRVANFDIVHIHSVFLWPTTIAAYWCRRRGVPYIIHTIGSLDPTMLAKSYEGWWRSLTSRAKKRLYLATVGKLDLDRASAIQYTSEADEASVRELNVRAPGYIVPLGVDPLPGDALGGQALRAKYPELDGKKIVLFLGRIVPNKGLDIIVKGLEALGPRGDFSFVVAGSGPQEYEEHVAEEVRRRGLAGRTVFLGQLDGDAKWSVLKESDVFVLPSYHENFPSAVVEAMAAGLPVVISDRVKIQSEIREAGAGIVTGLEPDEVASAIGRLLDDDKLRAQMGAAGERLTREQLSWEKAVRKLVKAYRAIIQTQDRSPSALNTG